MKKIFLLSLLTFLYLQNKAQIYKDKDAPVDERVYDLVSRMTLDEKFQYIGGTDNFYIMNITRLGIPLIKMSDGPVGVRTFGNCTAYPAGVLMAATWDTSMLNLVGHALGKDARARGVHILLGPAMNIYRIPINGRNFEYYGEDPFLASKIAVSYIKGLQSEGVMATPKHFAVNSFERNRSNVSAEIDERTLNEIYLPAFKASVTEGKSGSIMSAYNKINGIWCSHNNYLLNETLKDNWNFKGFVMSDWGATHNGLQAAKAGLDLEMPSGTYMNKTNLLPYLDNGQLSQSEINDKLIRIFNELIGFGFFDRNQTLSSIPLDNPENGEIALQAACDGIVLLKNKNVLPLKRDSITSIAVIGDLADQYVAGGGSSYATPYHFVSVYKGIDSLAGANINVESVSGISYIEKSFQNSIFYTDSLKTQSGLKSSFYNNKTLSGSPAYERTDQHINFTWTQAPGGVTGIGADNFSVRWTGYVIPESDGTYAFSVTSDDGFRLIINDTLFMEDWTDHAATTMNQEKALKSGKIYKVKLEYYENGGNAEIRFGYSNLDLAINPAIQLASSSDVAVICAGFGSNLEGEGSDRTFELPTEQIKLIKSVAAVNKNTIVILFAGGAVETGSWIDSVSAFIHAFYPGQYGGLALGKILFGDVNPSGKLPFSFDSLWSNVPSYSDYYAADGNEKVKYSEGVFTGYRFYDTATIVRPLYPFGFGLSYTTFDYSNMQLNFDDPNDLKDVTVSFDLKNSGDVAGKEISQVYVHDLQSSVERPFKELKAFNKVELQPNEENAVNLYLNKNSFKFYNADEHRWVFEPGKFEILVGTSSTDIRLRDTISLGAEMFKPEIEKLIPPDDEDYVDLEPQYSIEFSEKVNCQGTEFYIENYDNNSIVDTIKKEDIKGCGTRILTFSSAKLKDKTRYSVEIPDGFFVTDDARPFKGFLTKDDWNFKTKWDIISSVNNNTISDIDLYPNPVTNEININIPEELSDKGILELYNQTGQLILTKEYFNSGEILNLDISNLKPGYYLIKIKNINSVATGKILKLK